jgi:hypothetical protein
MSRRILLRSRRIRDRRWAQGISLPPRLKSEIKRELQRLELVVEMIATLEAERDAQCEADDTHSLTPKNTTPRKRRRSDKRA